MNEIDRTLPGRFVVSPEPKGKAKVTKTDIAWLAGFFDGEGCVMIRKRRLRWESMLRFVNSSWPIMRYISELTGGCLSIRQKDQPHNQFEVCLQHKRAERWAILMRPYLRIKADEVDLLLEFRKTIVRNRRRPLSSHIEDYRHQIAFCCKALKRRRYKIE